MKRSKIIALMDLLEKNTIKSSETASKKQTLQVGVCGNIRSVNKNVPIKKYWGQNRNLLSNKMIKAEETGS